MPNHGVITKRFTHHHNYKGIVNEIDISNDGKWVCVGIHDSSIIVWNPVSGEIKFNKTNNNQPVGTIAFSPDNKQIVTSSDGTICHWSSSTGKLLYTVQDDDWYGFIESIIFSQDGKRMALIHSRCSIFIFSGTDKLKINPVDELKRIAFSPDGTRIAVTVADWFHIYNTKTGKLQLKKNTTKTNTYPYGLGSIVFSRDGKTIITGGTDAVMKFFDAFSGKSLGIRFGHGDAIWSLASSPNNRCIVSGSEDWTIRLWDLKTKQCVYVFKGHTDCVWSVKFSPDGKKIISGSNDNTVKVWDIPKDIIVSCTKHQNVHNYC